MTTFEFLTAAAETWRTLRRVLHHEFSLGLRQFLFRRRNLPPSFLIDIRRRDVHSGNAVQNLCLLHCSSKELLSQRVVAKRHALVVPQHSLVIEVVYGAVVSQKQAPPDFRGGGWRDVQLWLPRRRLINCVVFSLDIHTRPLPNGPAELNPPAVSQDLLSDTLETIVRLAAWFRCDGDVSRHCAWIYLMAEVLHLCRDPLWSSGAHNVKEHVLYYRL